MGKMILPIQRPKELIELTYYSAKGFDTDQHTDPVIYNGRNLTRVSIGAKTKSFFKNVFNIIKDFFNGRTSRRHSFSEIKNPVKPLEPVPDFLLTDETDEPVKTPAAVPRFQNAFPVFSDIQLKYKDDFLKEAKSILGDVQKKKAELFRDHGIPEKELQKLRDDFLAEYDAFFEANFDEVKNAELKPFEPSISLPELLPNLHDKIMAKLLGDRPETTLLMHCYTEVIEELSEEIHRRLRTYNRKLIPRSLPDPI